MTRRTVIAFREHSAFLTGRFDLHTLYVTRIRLPTVGLDSDVIVYIVFNDFGPMSRAYCEKDETDANEATVIENLLSGSE